MDMTAAGRQMRYSWTLIGVLAVLCAVLAVVQYRWIDEVAQANRERIKSEREAGLRRVRQPTISAVEGSAHGRAEDRNGRLPQSGIKCPRCRFLAQGPFHENTEIGPSMMARVAKHTGLKPEDL